MVLGSATAVVSVGVSDTNFWRIRPVDVVAEHDGNVLVGGGYLLKLGAMWLYFFGCKPFGQIEHDDCIFASFWC